MRLRRFRVDSDAVGVPATARMIDERVTSAVDAIGVPMLRRSVELDRLGERLVFRPCRRVSATTEL